MTQRKLTTKGLCLIAAIALACFGLTLASCASQSGQSDEGQSISSTQGKTNLGEYETIGEDPDMLADGTSGTAFQKGGEEEHQQDRISGGANTGGVQSENLDPIGTGAIDPQSSENPAPVLTEIGTPPAIPHTLDGRDDCASCHAAASSERPMPSDHVTSGITSDLCGYCHKSA